MEGQFRAEGAECCAQCWLAGALVIASSAACGPQGSWAHLGGPPPCPLLRRR